MAQTAKTAFQFSTGLDGVSQPEQGDQSLLRSLDVLRAVALDLDMLLGVDELLRLSTEIDGVADRLRATVPLSADGAAVRAECRQMLESVACGLVEVVCGNARAGGAASTRG